MTDIDDLDSTGVALSYFDGEKVNHTDVFTADSADIPRAVQKYLLPYEHRVIATRRHPVVLAGAAVVFGGALAGAWALNTWMWANGTAWPVAVYLLWATALAAVSWAVVKWLSWRATWFVATATRLILIHGLFLRRVEPLPLQRLTDCRMEATFFGRKWGWGTLINESFATDHALHTVTYLPYVEDLFNEVWQLRLPQSPGRGPSVE